MWQRSGHVLVIDAANVIGSRPDGWWRDREGAASPFMARVRAAVGGGSLDEPVTIVVEGRSRAGAAEGTSQGVTVLQAPGEGDDTIAEVAAPRQGSVA
jgi:hypothetical protein